MNIGKVVPASNKSITTLPPNRKTSLELLRIVSTCIDTILSQYIPDTNKLIECQNKVHAALFELDI